MATTTIQIKKDTRYELKKIGGMDEKKLKNPYPSRGNGDNKIIKGTKDVVYRICIGDYRAFYSIDKEGSRAYIFDILTSEQAHKKYGRL